MPPVVSEANLLPSSGLRPPQQMRRASEIMSSDGGVPPLQRGRPRQLCCLRRPGRRHLGGRWRGGPITLAGVQQGNGGRHHHAAGARSVLSRIRTNNRNLADVGSATQESDPTPLWAEGRWAGGVGRGCSGAGQRSSHNAWRGGGGRPQGDQDGSGGDPALQICARGGRLLTPSAESAGCLDIMESNKGVGLSGPAEDPAGEESCGNDGPGGGGRRRSRCA